MIGKYLDAYDANDARVFIDGHKLSHYRTGKIEIDGIKAESICRLCSYDIKCKINGPECKKEPSRPAFWALNKVAVKAGKKETIPLDEIKSLDDLAVALHIRKRSLTYITSRLKKNSDNPLHYSIRRETTNHGKKERLIEEPPSVLKSIQRRINSMILQNIDMDEYIHGFIKGKSFVTNAQRHIGKNIIISIDLKDFFPGIRAHRIYGLMQSIMKSTEAARTFTSLVTFRNHLPTGAPTSPLLSTMVARNMFRRLAGLAKSMDYEMSVYADDITFSSDTTKSVGGLISMSRRIIEEEGFNVNERKIKVMRARSRSTAQMVTGIIVNEKANIPRHLRRTLRACVHRASQGKKPTIYGAKLTGLLNFWNQVNPEGAQKQIQKLNKVSV